MLRLRIIFRRVEVNARRRVEVLHPAHDIIKLVAPALAPAHVAAIIGMRAVVALSLVALELDLLPQPIGLEIHHLHVVQHAQKRVLRIAGKIDRDLRRQAFLDQLRPKRQRFERAIRDRAVLPVHHSIAVQVAGHDHLGHRQRQRLIRHGPVCPERTPERTDFSGPCIPGLNKQPVVIEQHVVINRSRQFPGVQHRVRKRQRLGIGLPLHHEPFHVRLAHL